MPPGIKRSGDAVNGESLYSSDEPLLYRGRVRALLSLLYVLGLLAVALVLAGLAGLRGLRR